MYHFIGSKYSRQNSTSIGTLRSFFFFVYILSAIIIYCLFDFYIFKVAVICKHSPKWVSTFYTVHGFIPHSVPWSTYKKLPLLLLRVFFSLVATQLSRYFCFPIYRSARFFFLFLLQFHILKPIFAAVGFPLDWANVCWYHSPNPHRRHSKRTRPKPKISVLATLCDNVMVPFLFLDTNYYYCAQIMRSSWDMLWVKFATKKNLRFPFASSLENFVRQISVGRLQCVIESTVCPINVWKSAAKTLTYITMTLVPGATVPHAHMTLSAETHTHEPLAHFPQPSDTEENPDAPFYTDQSGMHIKWNQIALKLRTQNLLYKQIV